MVTELKKNYLFPSSLLAEKDPHIVDTVLGSCVSVILYDVKIKVGGINHYMLPLWNGQGLATAKYGNIAIEMLVEKVLKMGATKQNIIAKVFGGANQFGGLMNVGDRNIQMAIEYLLQHNIKIVSKSLGGELGRKIRFNTQTGEVLMKFLPKNVSL
jgi:chemotaxis protein CheD